MKGFLGLLLLSLLLLGLSVAGLEVFAPSPQRGLNGSTVVLPCNFSISKLPLDPKYLAILWSFKGKQILVYDNKGIKKDPRVTFDVEATKDGNASLTLANVTLSDGGSYSCLVVYSPDRIEKDIVLEVQVKPMVVLHIKTVYKESENTLLCEAAGFFPRDIEITWTLDGKTQNNSFLRESVENIDGTYNVTSSVTFTPTPDTKTLSCTVRHDSLEEPLQEDLQLVYEDRGLTWIIAACSVLVVVILIIIISAVLWKGKKSRKATTPFKVRDIAGPPKLIDGEKATLSCTVDNAPEDLCVTWQIRKDGPEQEIQTSQTRGHSEEEESLLDTSYVIKSQRLGCQYSSSLSFIPQIERHEDVIFICRSVCGQHNDEKTFHCRTIYGKPKMPHTVMRSLLVSGEIKYLLNLEKFYPKNIKIVWKCGERGTEEVVSSTESLSENPDRSYKVSSEIIIPEDRHKDTGFRVQVTWEHESMEKAESQELSIRDSDHKWTPVVEEIQIPRLLHGSPAALQCHVSEYFPDAIIVKWMRRDGDKLHEETDDNQRIISRRAANNTYSRTASLTITPELWTHQGAEYLCLVEHPSLERPMKKSTGRLQVYGKPQMSAPIEITMADSSRVQFSLNLQKFYPKDINISWYREDQSGKHGLSPTAEVISTRDNDLIYEVTSVVQIPDHRFRDPEIKIIVQWKHETMSMPEMRSLTIRDLPFRPQVGSLILPKLNDGKDAKLTCDISGYFPDLLSVIWFIKKDGNVTALPRESKKDRNYKMSHKGKRQKDNTYSCEASMTFTPIISSDEGSEIICRVEHPSEERPIERSTGPLHIDEKKPFFEKPIQDTMSKLKKEIFASGKKNQEIEKVEEQTESIGEEPQEETQDLVD
ncbi:uncharacterized protein [Phyllobates terribilis]|uniref:uncharacterized protein isoform X2 n=1 Tax=Phyllobates terribilis TaxID=111132 RepID=UPI003CCB65EF